MKDLFDAIKNYFENEVTSRELSLAFDESTGPTDHRR